VTFYITKPNSNTYQPLLTLWSTKGIKGRGGGLGHSPLLRLRVGVGLRLGREIAAIVRQLCGFGAAIAATMRFWCGFGAVLCGKFAANLWQLCGFAASTKQNYQTFLCDENDWATVCDGFAAKFDGFAAYATALCFSKFAVIMLATIATIEG
jgi:hypothetical protein